jgi:hypothetical protein
VLVITTIPERPDTMKKVKTTNDHRIFQKRSGRYAVQDKNKRWVHGEEKTKVLLDAELVSLPESKPKTAETPAEEESPTS